MDENTLQIISNIYDSVIDSSRWNDVLSSLVTLTNSESGLLLSCTKNPEHCNVYENYNIDPYWLELYDEHYFQYDPSMEVLSRSPNKVVSNHVIGPERKRLNGKSRVFYNEVLLPQNYYHSAGCCLLLPSQNHHALILTRNQHQGEFSKDRLRQLGIVTTHISKALRISQKMWEHRIFNKTLSNVLSKADVGIILFNQAGVPVYISEQAETDINGTSGLQLRNGAITATHPTENAKLQKLISDSIATASGSSLKGGGVLRLGKSGSSLQVAITPMNQDRFGSNRFGEPVYAAIILSKENGSKPLPRQALRQLYGLTSAEADTVSKLADGLSLQGIADVNCRSKETIRSQLKSAMAKTSTKQQSDLVRLVTTSLARFISEA